MFLFERNFISVNNIVTVSSKTGTAEKKRPYSISNGRNDDEDEAKKKHRKVMMCLIYSFISFHSAPFDPFEWL